MSASEKKVKDTCNHSTDLIVYFVDITNF